MMFFLMILVAILLGKGETMCHVNFPSYENILSSPTANLNPTGRQFLFPGIKFDCETAITKIIFRGEAIDQSYPYPLIQIYEERILAYYIKQKTIHINEIKEMNEVNGTVELIPSEPIRVDRRSVLGIYFPNNSTELSFANGATDSCLYVSSSEPLRFFYIISATRQRDCIPLLTVETFTTSSSRPTSSMLTSTSSMLTSASSMLTSTSSMLTSTSSMLTSASSMLTSTSSMLTSASSMLTSASSMLTSTSSMLTSASSMLTSTSSMLTSASSMLTSASSMLTSASSTVNSAIITTTSISAFSSTMISPSTTPNYNDYDYAPLWIIAVCVGGIVTIIIVCGFIIIVYIVVTRRKIIPSSNTVDQLYVLHPFQNSADNCMVLNDSYERPLHQYNRLMRHSSIATSHNRNTYQLNPCYGRSNSFSNMNPLLCPPPSPPVCSGTHSYEDPDLCYSKMQKNMNDPLQ